METTIAMPVAQRGGQKYQILSWDGVGKIEKEHD